MATMVSCSEWTFNMSESFFQGIQMVLIVELKELNKWSAVLLVVCVLQQQGEEDYAVFQEVLYDMEEHYLLFSSNK